MTTADTGTATEQPVRIEGARMATEIDATGESTLAAPPVATVGSTPATTTAIAGASAEQPVKTAGSAAATVTAETGTTTSAEPPPPRVSCNQPNGVTRLLAPVSSIQPNGTTRFGATVAAVAVFAGGTTRARASARIA